MKHRTALVNQVRGLLLEYGIVIPQGIARFRKRLPRVIEEADNGLSFLMRDLLQSLQSELRAGALVKRGHLTLPSFGALRMFGASRIPGPLPIAEVSCCPQAQSLALGTYQSVPHS